MRRSICGVFVWSLLVLNAGCTYLENRADDAMDLVDVGLTVSKVPCFSAYYDFVPIAPIGAGIVDGWFLGLGGGKFGAFCPHYEKSVGFIFWGEEELNYGDTTERRQAMDSKTV